MVILAEGEWVAANQRYEGWCRQCSQFTREHTEPDALGYHCPRCGGYEVVGAEIALLIGLIEFEV